MALFSVENGAIRIGLSAIKNIGIAIIEHIEQERKSGGKFKNFDDFVARMSFVTINKRVFEGFILSGAFDCFGINRRTLLQNFETVVDKAAKDRAVKNTGQFSMFDSAALKEQSNTVFYPLEEFSQWDKFRLEKEVSGIYISGHPLEGYTEFLNSFKTNTLHFISLNEETGMPLLDSDSRVSMGGMLVEAVKRFTKNGKEMGIGKLEDMHGTVEVFLSGNNLTKFKDVFVPDKLVTISGTVRHGNNDGDPVTLWINDIVPLNPKGREVNKKKICFYFDRNNQALLDKVQDILLAYPGHDETYVKAPTDKTACKLDIPVALSKVLLLEIEGLLGRESYRIAE
jgi:DNA polymerase-3 subunit alpha